MSGPLVIDVEGATLSIEDRELLKSPWVGAIILFSRNYQERAQASDLINAIRSQRPDIVIAVDQEGGRVQRFKEGFTLLPSLQKIGNFAMENRSDLPEMCFSLGWLMAAEVMSLGVDISFAPVLDLDVNSCEVIADRSFSSNPSLMTEMASAYIAGMNQAGMAATVKHFPGHGGVVEDSHLELPEDLRSFEDLLANDLIPFKELAKAYQAVMPAHVLYSRVDSQPAGFSKFWIKKILRKDFAFEGIVFSDDLTMKGAESVGGYINRVNLALDAGCDAVLICNNRTACWEVLAELDKWDSIPQVDWHKMRKNRNWTFEEVLANPRHHQAMTYIDRIRATP